MTTVFCIEIIFVKKYFEKSSFDPNITIFRDKGINIHGKMAKKASGYDYPIFSNGRASELCQINEVQTTRWSTR